MAPPSLGPNLKAPIFANVLLTVFLEFAQGDFASIWAFRTHPISHDEVLNTHGILFPVFSSE